MNARTAAALVVVALLAVAGATATGAFTTTTGIHENLEATPGTGPNGEYATVSDGQLAFEIDQVNRRGITRFAGVFSLTYTGNDSADVWVGDDSPAVTFTALSNPIEGRASAVTLGPGESLSVGVSVDTTETGSLNVEGVSLNARLAGDTGGAESVSVSQSEPGVVEVSATNVSANDPVTVDTTGSSTSENATVDSLAVTTTRSTDLAMSVSMGTENGSAPAFEFGGSQPAESPSAGNGSDDAAAPNDSGAIGYINVSHEADDETIGGASFTFTVEKATLDQRGLNHSEVQLYRYHGGSWNGVSTSMVGESPDAYTFQADSPGLSVFAIGERGADEEETTDDSGGTGGGQVPDRDEPTDSPTPTATDTPTPEATGTDTSMPNGTATDAGTATATPTAPDTPTPTATPGTGEQAVEPIEEPRGFSLGRIGAVMGLVVLVGLFAYYRRRRA